DLWGKIHFPDVPSSSSFEVFSKRFLVPSDHLFVLDRVASVLDVEPLLQLICACRKYPSLRASVSNGPQFQRNMARRFLRELPRLQGDGEVWFWSLIDACAQDAHNIYHTLPCLMPDWQTQLVMQRPVDLPSSLPLTRLDTASTRGGGCRPPSEFEHFRNTITVEGTAVMPQLREYQKELMERTERGEITILCAPTGSGKTVVVMIEPTSLLVEQQVDLFKITRRMNTSSSSSKYRQNISGERQLISFLSGDIVVMTHQILVNLFRAESDKVRLYVADITLILLDKCHHTDKKNPFNQIMQTIKEASHERPQVIGLTASLGVGEH
ncbi:hypothetical protein PENTCL1PPCAC_1783, partial [Pristionchus entomophagus]